ncbi:MAG: hypothetical protein N3D10_00965 [Candidatus Micrarchaeota archaeon]|nr:hypothetical protein [Candidatus Micrarchaeota archaeon]
MYWDNRYDVFLNLPFIRRDIFPTYPEISYGEDKIAANKLKDYYKHAKKFVLEEEFLRFQEDFSIHSFIKRYLWYGRTFLPYLKLCADKKEYIRILLSVFGVFFPIFLLIPFFVGFFDSIKFLKIYPANLVFFPLFAVFASWLMGVGFLLGFFYKDLGH